MWTEELSKKTDWVTGYELKINLISWKTNKEVNYVNRKGQRLDDYKEEHNETAKIRQECHFSSFFVSSVKLPSVHTAVQQVMRNFVLGL